MPETSTNYGRLPQGMNAETLYSYWDKLDKSLTDEQKAGILGNIWEESKFNPNATAKGFRGLTQMGGNIMKQFPTTYGAWNNADNVFRYVNDYATGRTPKIKTGQAWSGNLGYNQKAYLAAKHTTAADSAKAWHTIYERAKAGAAPRMKYATQIFNHMRARNAANQSAPTTETPTIAAPTLEHTEPNDVTKVVTTPVAQPIQMQKRGGKLKRHINHK